MRKFYLPTILFLLGLVLMIPAMVLAVQDVVISSAIDVYLSDPGATLTISPVTVDQIAVGTSTVTITMSAGGSNVTVTSADRYKYVVTGITDPGTVCSEASSVITLYGQTSQTAVTLDPAGTCPSGGGGGGGGGAAASAAPAQPSSSTGEVTATASAGGNTSIVSDGVTASVTVPVGAVSANTVVNVTPTATTEAVVATAVATVPSGKTVVGGKAYNYSATSGGVAVSTFSKAVTVSITYTDAQVAGLNVSSLKIYYWDETADQWTALTSTVNTTEKTVSASATHFTYFAIMGSAGTTGMTLAELKAEIVRITALIADLQAQLLEMIGAVEGCTITSFDRNLQLAMSGDDVKCLQVVLNSSADTQVASSGVGSSGNETNYFGSLTKAAVVKFQEKYADEVLAPWELSSGNGFVGSTTREKLNELLVQ